MNNYEILSGAPRFITNRFNSVNKYVWETLIPEQTRKELIGKKDSKKDRKEEFARLRGISNEASTVVFVFLLNKLFNDGSKAAKHAVDTFKDLDVDGFYIGSNFFSGRNEKVMQGEIIAKKLIDSLGESPAKKLVIESNYIYQIMDEYKKFI
ncbi:MAG: hypothetical protein GXO79_03575 [Chlorobi bacterium]|nr:hypothetical protein [Chlorobiota bacterium]